MSELIKYLSGSYSIKQRGDIKCHSCGTQHNGRILFKVPEDMDINNINESYICNDKNEKYICENCLFQERLYFQLLSSGLSNYEAKGTVWND